MSWKKILLGDFLTLKRGYDLASADRVEGNIPIVSSSGITGNHNIAKATGPGVVTGRYGTLGEVFYIEGDYWPLNTALYVNDFKGNLPKFTAYFLQVILSGITSDKAAVPGVNRNDLHAREVNAPLDLGVQKAIIEILSPYDDLIENNRRRIQLLEESARMLYKEWFVHFRFPGHEHVKVVDGVPEGWAKGSIGNLAKVNSGYAFKSKDWQNEGLAVIKIKNIIGDGTVDTVNCDCISPSIAEKASKFVIPQQSLLIAMTGATVGKVGIMNDANNKIYLNQRVGIIQSKNNLSMNDFFFTYFQTDLAQSQIQNLAGGAAQPNISATQIEALEILLPQKQILTSYLDSVRPLFSQRSILLEQINKTAKARDLLLPRLMNGQLL